jgi:hypothetical protein
MIVLDTNVISEAMKPASNPLITDWLNKQIAETLFISSVTLAELHYGIACLPAGRKKDTLNETLISLLHLFNGRVLVFDIDAANAYGVLTAQARAAGKGFPAPDGYIAAIDKSKEFIVVTRDMGSFIAAKIPVINPWELGN